MSKQLLHAYKSHVVIAALNHRAFAVVSSNEAAASSPDEKNSSTVVELMAPLASSTPSPPKPDEKSSNKKKKQKKETDTSNEQKKEETAEEEKQTTNNDQDAKTIDENGDKNEIQAVCSTEIESNIWLAVSRQDKTLSLYCIPSISNEKQQQSGGAEADAQKQGHQQKYPVAIYISSKRAKCLSFGCIPSSLNGSNDCHVIIAGDLSGDAFAYPVPISAASTTPNADTPVTATSTPRRLLLGHTASMLTGLEVVPSSSAENQQLILTADRDEKIRVSHFPESHLIHGYLLGHSAFVSSMAAVTVVDNDNDSGNRTLCLTGSGDGTVRLWDYQLCKEVGMVPVVVQKSSDEGAGDEEDMAEENEEEVIDKEDDADELMDQGDDKNDFGNEKNDDEEEDEEDYDDEDDDEEESYDAHTIAVPISVALSPDAQYAVVARDGIASIDIHPIPPPAKSSTWPLAKLFPSYMVSLHKKQTLECPSQPLDVKCLSDGSVLVLMREPDYLLHYRCRHCTNNGEQSKHDHEFESVAATSPFVALQQVACSENISMPTTILERDQEGEWKLQKKEDRKELTIAHVGAAKNAEDENKDGDATNKDNRLHWNDPGRKVKAHLAAQRRRKRKKGEKEENGEE